MIQSRSDPPLENYFPLDVLQCYNLPFGALGFISHVLTYYTIVCLWYDRSPIWPFPSHRLTLGPLDFVLSFVGLAACIATAAITINNCKNTWQLLLIAVWKLSMSVLNGLTGIHVSVLKYRSSGAKPMKTKQAAWWLLLCGSSPSVSLFDSFNLLSLFRCSRDGRRIDRTREPRFKNRIQYSRSPRAEYRLPRYLRCRAFH